MATNTISAIATPYTNFHNQRIHSHSLALPLQNLYFEPKRVTNIYKQLTLTNNYNKNKKSREMRKLRSVEEETLIPEEVVNTEQQDPVAVPVSPSDTLTMYFQADGTMNESAIPTVTKALEETEGITNLKVQVLEGIANVELTKQTTVQATGVASNLVETIQGAGFKLQTLNLSFEGEEDVLV
ncbi:hypothetical protein CFOL_v3_23214 [Cephalotus follicularis]|uniref:Uncharacterized protein n=1 Tax=Cephalotus follicularis TaxID=3775 RepID=A0A1Q3CI70_CEPFO|nr:hypothetical protein CFOL_v3_23214 [Cephalotus follicularis]